MTHISKPNVLAPKEEKIKPSYGLQWGRYIVSKSVSTDFSYFNSRRQRIKNARSYAQGNQSNELYKQLYNAVGDETMRNLDFTPLGVGAKFVNSLCDDILGDEMNFRLRAIDATSQSQRKEERNRVLGNFYDKDFIEEMSKKTGINIAEGEFIPETLEEVELYMNIGYKQGVEIAMQEAIKYTFKVNDYDDEVRRLLLLDLINAGRAAAYCNVHPTQGIIQEYVDIENFVSSEAVNPNGKDLEWAGQLKWISVSQLRIMSRGEISEKQLEEIANKYKSRYGNQSFYQDYYSNNQNTESYGQYQYSYDSYIIPMLGFAVKVSDKDKQEVVNRKGVEIRYRKKDTYKNDKAKVIEDVYENVYEGYHIVDTDVVFGWGQQKNIIRPNKNFHKAILPYVTYAPQYYNETSKSLTEQVIPIINQINIAYLRLQDAMIKAKLNTTSINIEAWTDVAMGGKDWTPLELQDVWQATDIAYHRGHDDEGNYLQDPVKVQAHAIQLSPFIEVINFQMSLLRQILGFTREREGVTNTKQLVGTTEIAIEASRNSTKFLEHGLNAITKQVAQITAYKIQGLKKDNKYYKVYEEAIGSADMAVISTMQELSLATFSIFIDLKPSNEETLALERDIQTSVSQKELRVEDGAMIRQIAKQSGINAAYQYMSVRRKRYIAEQQKQLQQQKQMEAQYQIQVQQQAQQAKAQEIQAENQRELQKIQGEIEKLKTEYQLKGQLSEQEFYQDAQLEGVSVKKDMGKEKFRQDRMDERALKTAKYNAQSKQETDKVKAGKKKEVDEDEIGESKGLKLDELID